MNDRDLHNLEGYLIALSVGPGRSWAQEFIIAGAWASQVHQLGASIAHIESHKNSQAYKQAIWALTGLLVSFRLCNGVDADYYAKQGLDWWLFGLCPSCTGTGVTKEQKICDYCGGSLRVKGTELDRKCGLMIDSACDAYDAGIGKYLRDSRFNEHPQPKRSHMDFSEEGAKWTPPAFCHD